MAQVTNVIKYNIQLTIFYTLAGHYNSHYNSLHSNAVN